MRLLKRLDSIVFWTLLRLGYRPAWEDHRYLVIDILRGAPDQCSCQCRYHRGLRELDP